MELLEGRFSTTRLTAVPATRNCDQATSKVSVSPTRNGTGTSVREAAGAAGRGRLLAGAAGLCGFGCAFRCACCADRSSAVARNSAAAKQERARIRLFYGDTTNDEHDRDRLAADAARHFRLHIRRPAHARPARLAVRPIL